MEWIVCVVADANFPDGDGFDFVLFVIFADDDDVDDIVANDFVVDRKTDDEVAVGVDNDKSGGGCFDRTRLKYYREKNQLFKKNICFVSFKFALCLTLMALVIV